MNELRATACPLCEAMCGLRVRVQDGRVTEVRGDPEDVFSRGHLCPKAAALPDLHDDPDRVRQPLKRTATGWEPMSWDRAFDEIATRIVALQREHGADAMATYLGNPTIHNLGAMVFAPELVRAVGSRNRYSATSVDQLPQMLASYLVFGHQLLLPVPDVDRTDLLVILGGNPLASHGSLMSAPGIKKRLEAVQARGGRVVVIDPRRTETAAMADLHLAIRPGTDALLLAALVHEVLAHGPRLGHLAATVDGLDALREAVADFPPHAVAAATGLDAESIRSLARDLLATPRAAVYGRLGMCTQATGGAAAWLLLALNAVSGHLDTEGGAMFTQPAVDVLYQGGARAGSFGRWHSRVRGLPEFGGELPVAALAEEMLEPGRGQIRGLITFAGNPALSTPNGGQLDGALAGLDLFVAIDPYLTATARHAHYVLPPVSALQRPHYDLALHVLAVRNVARWSDAVLPTAPDERHDWQICAALTSRLLAARGAPVRRRAAARAMAALGPERIVDLGLRAGRHGGLRGLSVRRLRAARGGVDLGPLRPCLAERLPPGARRVDLAPAPFLADLPRLRALLAEPAPDLVLIGRRDVRNCNSWMHNVRRLAKGGDRCTLLMHPDDAATRGLADGAQVEVRSRVGRVEVPVELTDRIRRGVVSLPHGFGHGKAGTRLSVAAEKPGASVNDLTDHLSVDPVSGNAALSGVPVDVRLVAPVAPPRPA